MKSITTSALVRLLNEGFDGRIQFSARLVSLIVGEHLLYQADDERNWVLSGVRFDPKRYELHGTNHNIKISLREGEQASYSSEHNCLHIPLDFPQRAEIAVQGLDGIVY